MIAVQTLMEGHVDGRPYRVSDDHGWVVRAADGSNAFEKGWRWNSRDSARSFKVECELFGHKPLTIDTR